jgi:Mg-chelatase subunit ChlD
MRLAIRKPTFLFLSFLLLLSLCLPFGRHSAKAEVLIRNSVDIIIAIDTTGSMAKGISAVQQWTNWFADQLEEKEFDYRLGLIDFKDIQFDQNPVWYNFTSDVNKFTSQVGKLKASGGGGDGPESGIDAMLLASDKFKQYGRPEAGKMLIVVTDDVFHEPEDGYNTQSLGKKLGQEGIVTNIITRLNVSRDGLNTTTQCNNILRYTKGYKFNFDNQTGDGVKEAYEEIIKQIGKNNKPSIKSFSVRPPAVFLGDTLSGAMSATDPDGDTVKYTWKATQLGTNTTKVLSQSSTFSYKPTTADIGTWTITGIATDSWGEVDSKSTNITIGAPDLAIMIVNPDVPQSITKGENLHIKALVYNVNTDWPVTSAYTVGLRLDGNIVDSVQLTDIGWAEFNIPFNQKQGNHQVEIVVDTENNIIESNENNNIKSYTLQVVNRAPSADFSYSPDKPTEDVTEMIFQANATDPDGDELTYKWTYKDPKGNTGTLSTYPSFRRTFNQSGTWTITLEVADPYGGKATVVKNISVLDNNTLDAQILHTDNWAEKLGISADDPNFLAGEGFVVKAQTSDNATSVNVIPPAILADEKALTSNSDHTSWTVQLDSKNISKIAEGPYPWVIRATFKNGQVIEKPVIIYIKGAVSPDIHLTE